MSDLYYKIVRMIGRPIVFGASRTLVLHEERAQISGSCLLAANHASFHDSTILVGTTSRMIDWLSIVELFQNPWQKWFMEGINCLPLDRERRDSGTVREIVRRLKAGRMVGIFPEAHLKKGIESVVYGGDFASGIVRLAEMSGAPVVPVIVLGAGQFSRVKAWLPMARTPLIVNYGKALAFSTILPKLEARLVMKNQLQDSFRELFEEITSHTFWQTYARTSWWLENYPDPT